MSAARTASVIIAAAGLISLGIGFVLLQKRLELIKKWKPVDAQVVRFAVDEHISDSEQQSKSYSARYELAYTFNGRPIRSTAHSEDEFDGEAAVALAELDRHGPGTHGIVYVNTDDPLQVRLNIGMNVKTLEVPLWVLLPGVSLMLFALSLWCIGTPSVAW